MCVYTYTKYISLLYMYIYAYIHTYTFTYAYVCIRNTFTRTGFHNSKCGWYGFKIVISLVVSNFLILTVKITLILPNTNEIISKKRKK